VHVGDTHVINLCKKLPYVLIRGFSGITHELSKIWYPETPWIRNCVKVLRIRLLLGPSLTLRCKPKLPQSPSDLIPNLIVYLTLYPWVRSSISRCPREKYVRNRTVRHALVIRLLKVWVGRCGVNRKPWVTQSGRPPLG
jgi:hypothetical protein